MTRRALLGLLAAAALDPEKLLWIPGKKLISIPAPAPTPFKWPNGIDWKTGTHNWAARALYFHPVAFTFETERIDASDFSYWSARSVQ